MNLWEAVAIFLAGVAAGTINAVVGSGTLVTFPTLLAFGYSPVMANISNTLGLVSGGLSGTWGYRRELSGQYKRLKRLVPMSVCGSVTAAVLLLTLPDGAFGTIVPALLGLALVLVVIQPRLQVWLKGKNASISGEGAGHDHPVLAAAGTYSAGIYGGYFGAAQGVLLIGILGTLPPEPLQRVNALKNLLSVVVNAFAALVFLCVALDQIHWGVVALISFGSLLGALWARASGGAPPASPA